MPRVHTSHVYLPGGDPASGRHEYDVAELRPFFLVGDEDDAEFGSDGFVTAASAKDADVLSTLPKRPHGPTLSYEYYPGRGFSLAWSRVEADGRLQPTVMSVGNRQLLHGFLVKPNQAQVPMGTFISGELAFRVLEDFAAAPDRLSGAIDWVAANDLDWPDPEE
ncbi:hypothetical protein ACFQS2_13135 [Brachybacterium sp. GCM10030267]|uniref:hypothetical protein n=1 Tax=unclassified Brachybacterium TaxID=2623841 RepID=UPI00361C5171